MNLPLDHAERLARARLSLEGLALGDAFGERFFTHPHLVESLIARRAVPAAPWGFTDDTEMAISVVEVLAEHGHVAQDALAAAFGRRYLADPSRGYGGAAHRILAELGRGAAWGPVSRAVFSGQGSLGNGGGMRAAPLGAYFADDLERVALEAARSAEVTHAHPEGQAGAVAVALAAALAWRQTRSWPTDPSAFVREVADLTPAGEVQSGLLQACSFPPEFSAQSAASLLGNGSHVTAPDTVPFCVWAAARFGGGTWEEAIWETLSVLGDRDTTCAIVGGILVLAHGAEALPPAWLAAREALPRRLRGLG